jgi:very-short-patch-repair endonuclease
MIDRYGVAHALQSGDIRKKQQSTLMRRYGTDSLYLAGLEKRTSTNMSKFGAPTPLESEKIQEKTRFSYQQRHGFVSPFAKFNAPENSDTYRGKARDTWIRNHPEYYDYDQIRQALEQYSYTRASEILGLYPTHLKNVAERQGWHDLLPKKSSYENLIAKFLTDHGITFLQNSRSIIAPYELDFYIHEARLAIEVNGLIWHSEKFGGKDRSYHVKKTRACQEIGVRLIQVFEDEFNNHQETVLSILKTALGIQKRRIFARQCDIRQISVPEARDFCERYHLQGYSTSSLRYGLYFEKQLMSVMTFKRKSSSSVELSRYCLHPDVQITGGAQRLFSNFLTQNSGLAIYTYSDNRYFTGELYRQLGFDFSHETPCNYWYFKDSTRRFHRSGFTKKRLVQKGYDPSLSEWQIMQSIKYDRIWDCGNKKWIMKI